MVRDFIISYSDTTVSISTISCNREDERTAGQSADPVQEEAESLPLLHKKERAGHLYKAAFDLDRNGRNREALPLYEESLRLCRELGDRVGQKDILRNIGRIHQEGCRYTEALACLEESLALQRESGDRYGEAVTLEQIGRIYKERCEHGEALRYLEESLCLCREIGNRAGEGTALADIARIYRARCDFAKALPLFEQCLTIFQEIGDRTEETFMHWSIGCIAYGEGKKDKAEQHISRAVQLAKAISHPSLEKYRRALERLRAVLLETSSETGQGETLSSSCPAGILPENHFSTR